MPESTHNFNGPYDGQALDNISFPIGGLGAGMFCLDGAGAFSHFSIQHQPDLFNERRIFSTLSAKNSTGKVVARVVEGPVPTWKVFFPWKRESSGMGCGNRTYGLPRFESARFEARFPFGTVALHDDQVPVKVRLTGWSPFVPGDADASSLPVGAVDYHFENKSAEPQEIVYAFHAENFLSLWETGHSIEDLPGGFCLKQDSTPTKFYAKAAFGAWIDDPAATPSLSWFRGGWFDPLTMLWKGVEEGRFAGRGEVTDTPPAGFASVYLPFTLAPGESKTVRLLLGWHVPYSPLRYSPDTYEAPTAATKDNYFRPWYGEKFKDIEEVASFWTRNVGSLFTATESFTKCFYDSTLPPEVLEAVAANLTILKSPTVLRQFDGRMWAWEGSGDEKGSCHGTCTHVWNYAQALPHLFPALERGLRETEFFESQDERGHQSFRASLPLGPSPHDFHAAADGQLGGLLKLYRDWRISGDTAWLGKLWPRARQSLDYCIETWDPDHRGALLEPHHNTYDIEFWGADGMCSSFYIGALQAAVVMGRALNEDTSKYQKLLAAGKSYLEEKLFNGEYFVQKVQWQDLHSPDPVEMSEKAYMVTYSTEGLELLHKEGPKYQYSDGCLSDGVLGEWMGWTAGLESVLSREKIERHLASVFRHNFRSDLYGFPNPQRPAYAFGHEGGLILCSWPRGGKPSLPFVYSEEVWTGIEYQVASHLISLGRVEEGLEIVRACRRRYDGRLRNPFDELECGHWYARAMASYALLQALSGARYDAIDRVLYLEPKIKGDFRSFLAAATGYGTVGVKSGEPFLEVKSGAINLDRIAYTPA